MAKVAAFINTLYQLSVGSSIAPIRVHASTAAFAVGAATNAAPAGPANLPNSVKVSGHRRTKGITPRKVRFRFVTAPTGYVQGSVISLPLLNNAIYAAIPAVGGAGTYLTVAVTIVGKTPEYDN